MAALSMQYTVGNQLMEAIHSVHSGETVLHPTIARRVLNQLATSGE